MFDSPLHSPTGGLGGGGGGEAEEEGEGERTRVRVKGSEIIGYFR